MQLLRPTISMKAAYLDFAQEWARHGEEITPYAARLLDMTYEAWLEHTYRMETTAPEGFVTGHTFFCMEEDGRILGAVNIRHTLNDNLLRYGGHIGYGVRPSARRQGHASAMLQGALSFCRGLGLEAVLLTCDRENKASARTIQRAGGILENEVPESGRVTQRYWIDLAPREETQ